MHTILPKTSTCTPSYIRHAHTHRLTQDMHIQSYTRCIHTVLHETHTPSYTIHTHTHCLTQDTHIHIILHKTHTYTLSYIRHTYPVLHKTHICTPSYIRHTHTVLLLAGKRPVADLHRKTTEGAQSWWVSTTASTTTTARAASPAMRGMNFSSISLLSAKFVALLDCLIVHTQIYM